jgi:hypothetical protein
MVAHQGDPAMDDRKTRMSDDSPDTSWIWIGGSLAAVFLVLGFFAILWGGNSPTGSANMSPATDRTITSRNLGEPVRQAPAPSTTGQGAR